MSGGLNGKIRKIESQNPAGQTKTVSLAYDEFGRIARQTDENGLVTDFKYDPTKTNQLISLDVATVGSSIRQVNIAFPDAHTSNMENQGDLALTLAAASGLKAIYAWDQTRSFLTTTILTSQNQNTRNETEQ